MLVGPPGIGKSDTIKAARELLQELEEDGKIKIAPKNVSSASLLDRLVEAKCQILRPGQDPPIVEYNALVLLADEFSTLVPKYDHAFITFLTDLYEGQIYDESKRGNNLKNKITNPCVNLLSGNTPSNLLKFLPEGAWDQGFASRTILVYSGDRVLSNIFEDSPYEEGEYSNLLHDLRLISGLYGRASLSQEYIEAIQSWREADEKPRPTHPKLTHYCSRRTAHVARLSMVASISRGNSLLVTREHFEEAREWLIEAEAAMPDIFLAGVTGGDSAAMDEAWYYVQASWAKKKVVVEHDLIHFIRERIPPHSVIRVIDIMEKDGSLKKHLDAKTGIVTYTPGPRRPRYA